MHSYLITIAESEAKNAAEASERLAARTAYGKQLGAALVDSGRIHPSREGKRAWIGHNTADFLGGVRLEAPTLGKRITKGHVTDGPFMEAKEVIGGFFFQRAASLAEAVEWAKQTSFVQFGGLEIRELWRT